MHSPKRLLPLLVMLSTLQNVQAATTKIENTAQQDGIVKSKVLTLTSFFKPIRNKESLNEGLSGVTYQFTGSPTDTVGLIRLCTATDSTCGTCNSGVVVIDTGTPLNYNQTYVVLDSSMAAYLSDQGSSAGNYNIGMYVQSSSANCSDTLCGTNADTGSNLLCMQATYDGMNVTATAQTDNGMANLNMPSLIVNPGFETGDFTGWTVNGDNIDVISSNVHSGTYAVRMGTVGTDGTLTQNITLPSAGNYRLSFWLATGGSGPSHFSVTIGGNTVYNVTDPSSSGYVQLVFTANLPAGSTSLEFAAQNDPSYFYIDDINLIFLG